MNPNACLKSLNSNMRCRFPFTTLGRAAPRKVRDVRRRLGSCRAAAWHKADGVLVDPGGSRAIHHGVQPDRGHLGKAGSDDYYDIDLADLPICELERYCVEFRPALRPISVQFQRA